MKTSKPGSSGSQTTTTTDGDNKDRAPTERERLTLRQLAKERERRENRGKGKTLNSLFEECDEDSLFEQLKCFAERSKEMRDLLKTRKSKMKLRGDAKEFDNNQLKKLLLNEFNGDEDKLIEYLRSLHQVLDNLEALQDDCLNILYTTFRGDTYQREQAGLLEQFIKEKNAENDGWLYTQSMQGLETICERSRTIIKNGEETLYLERVWDIPSPVLVFENYGDVRDYMMALRDVYALGAEGKLSTFTIKASMQYLHAASIKLHQAVHGEEESAEMFLSTKTIAALQSTSALGNTKAKILKKYKELSIEDVNRIHLKKQLQAKNNAGYFSRFMQVTGGASILFSLANLMKLAGLRVYHTDLIYEGIINGGNLVSDPDSFAWIKWVAQASGEAVTTGAMISGAAAALGLTAIVISMIYTSYATGEITAKEALKEIKDVSDKFTTQSSAMLGKFFKTQLQFGKQRVEVTKAKLQAFTKVFEAGTDLAKVGLTGGASAVVDGGAKAATKVTSAVGNAVVASVKTTAETVGVVASVGKDAVKAAAGAAKEAMKKKPAPEKSEEEKQKDKKDSELRVLAEMLKTVEIKPRRAKLREKYMLKRSYLALIRLMLADDRDMEYTYKIANYRAERDILLKALNNNDMNEIDMLLDKEKNLKEVTRQLDAALKGEDITKAVKFMKTLLIGEKKKEMQEVLDRTAEQLRSTMEKMKGIDPKLGDLSKKLNKLFLF